MAENYSYWNRRASDVEIRGLKEDVVRIEATQEKMLIAIETLKNTVGTLNEKLTERIAKLERSEYADEAVAAYKKSLSNNKHGNKRVWYTIGAITAGAASILTWLFDHFRSK